MFKLKILSIAFLSVLLILPITLYAGGSSGSKIVSRLKVNQEGRVEIWPIAGDWANPDSCNQSNKIILLPNPSGTVNEYYSEMYALTVASYLQGKKIDAYLNGCTTINSVTYPIAIGVASSE